MSSLLPLSTFLLFGDEKSVDALNVAVRFARPTYSIGHIKEDKNIECQFFFNTEIWLWNEGCNFLPFESRVGNVCLHSRLNSELSNLNLSKKKEQRLQSYEFNFRLFTATRRRLCVIFVVSSFQPKATSNIILKRYIVVSTSHLFYTQVSPSSVLKMICESLLSGIVGTIRPLLCGFTMRLNFRLFDQLWISMTLC